MRPSVARPSSCGGGRVGLSRLQETCRKALDLSFPWDDLGAFMSIIYKEKVAKHTDLAEATRFFIYPLAAIEKPWSMPSIIAATTRPAGRSPHQSRGDRHCQLPRPGRLDSDRGPGQRQDRCPPLSQPADRRIPQGTRPYRGALHGHSDHPRGDGEQRLSAAEILHRRGADVFSGRIAGPPGIEGGAGRESRPKSAPGPS